MTKDEWHRVDEAAAHTFMVGGLAAAAVAFRYSLTWPTLLAMLLWFLGGGLFGMKYILEEREKG